MHVVPDTGSVFLQDVRDFYKFQQYLLVTRVYSDPLASQPAAAAAAAGPSSGKPPAGPKSKKQQQQPQQQQAKKQKGEQPQQQQVRGAIRALVGFVCIRRHCAKKCICMFACLRLLHCWRNTDFNSGLSLSVKF
jgi:hypothetical protein